MHYTRTSQYVNGLGNASNIAPSSITSTVGCAVCGGGEVADDAGV